MRRPSFTQFDNPPHFAASVFLYLSLCRRAALLGSHPRAPRSSFMGACAGCIGVVCVLQAVALALK
jgi:hypothetical protein